MFEMLSTMIAPIMIRNTFIWLEKSSTVLL